MTPNHSYKVTEQKRVGSEMKWVMKCIDCNTSFPLKGETSEERSVHMMVILSYFQWEPCEHSLQSQLNKVDGQVARLHYIQGLSNQ